MIKGLINNYDIFEEALIFRNFSKYFSYLGKYAMRDLVQKLPSGNPQRDVGTSDDTIAAVLATLNEVIKKHPEFSRFTHCFFIVFTRAKDPFQFCWINPVKRWIF